MESIARSPLLREQVLQILRDEILHRRPVGGSMPPEVDLARQLKVSRTTVRAAYAVLEEEGLIERRRRLGTFIIAKTPKSRRTGQIGLVFFSSAEMMFMVPFYARMIGEIWEGNFPNRDLSLFGSAWRLGIAATAHVGIGYDIIHQHPNFDGSATGQASYTDFLIFTRQVQDLEGGVFLCFGSAVMGPEVYLKALSMARNVAAQEGREIRHFTTAVFDLIPISGDLHAEAPKSSPQYYYRPYKTILVRTVADGGESYYFEGDHRVTWPNLWRLLVNG